jgi:hypothetical protein
MQDDLMTSQRGGREDTRCPAVSLESGGCRSGMMGIWSLVMLSCRMSVGDKLAVDRSRASRKSWHRRI